MSLRFTRLCTIALAFSLAGCPENPAPVDAPVTPDGGDGGGPRDGGRDGGPTDGGGDGGTGPVCGNSVVDGTEACDDGNTTANDGCSATCTEETGWTCDGADPTVCTEVCGDGTLVGDEAGTNGCDDGGTAADDGCSATCTVEMGWACAGAPSVCTADCGDGVINGVEVCDDNNNADNDGCSMSCQVETGWTCDTAEPTVCTSVCGDGAVAVGAETCDDGNTDDADGCSASCATESGYDCSTGTCLTICGDTMIVGAEECDDGNAISETCAYGAASCVICASDCTNQPGLTSLCGDGNFDTVNEMCDDGNTVTETACAYGTATCTQCEADCTATIDLTGNICGDTVTDATNETCDDGNTTDGDGCDATCQTEAVCGDGAVEGAEACDDGNTAVGDGCDSDCVIEPGFSCEGALSLCGLDEIEPNEDGTPSTGGSGTTANDFNATARTNADNNFAMLPLNASSGYRLIRGTFSVAGDEDVYAIQNDTGAPVSLGAGTWRRDAGFGIGVACGVYVDATTIGDTAVRVYDSTGASVANNDDRRTGIDICSFARYEIPAGARVYVHVMDYGDNTLQPPYLLELTFAPVACGNGLRTGAEACDDGNTTVGDGCSATCTVESGFSCYAEAPDVCRPLCGNGESNGTEACDDGNATAGDGCSATCTIESGFICSGFPSVCRVRVCGDGFRDAPETCDDGNAADSDGCSSVCAVEPDYTCSTATPNVCTPNPYLITSIPAACVDMTAGVSQSIISDDAVTTSAALPFAFTYFGAAATNWVMSSNGNLQLITTAGSTEYGNTALPNTSAPNSTIAAFWDDLLVTTTPGTPLARVLTTGTGPTRVFVAEWANFRPSGATGGLTFQAHLYETTNVIEFHYCSITGTSASLTGGSATIGLENATGTVGVQRSRDTTGAISAGSGFRFTPR